MNPAPHARADALHDASINAPGGAPHATYFAAPVCRNCGASLATRYCGDCGQPRALRLGGRDLGREAWQQWRWFDFEMVRAGWRILTRPGTVARDYILGARKRHVHPLKLLLLAIGVLLLVLAQSDYLASGDARVGRAMELVRSYANWSFSLGIVAILAASLLLFGRRGYTLAEHLVLALYCHFLILCAAIVNLLPTLVWRTPGWLAAHKSASAFYMDAIEIGIVLLAFQQFFRLEARRDGVRLLLAGVAFALIKWLLLRAYAYALVRLVLAQLG